MSTVAVFSNWSRYPKKKLLAATELLNVAVKNNDAKKSACQVLDVTQHVESVKAKKYEVHMVDLVVILF